MLVLALCLVSFIVCEFWIDIHYADDSGIWTVVRDQDCCMLCVAILGILCQRWLHRYCWLSVCACWAVYCCHMVSFMTLQYSGCVLSSLDASIHFLRCVHCQQMACTPVVCVSQDFTVHCALNKACLKHNKHYQLQLPYVFLFQFMLFL